MGIPWLFVVDFSILTAMGIEIERKFLVHEGRWQPQQSGTKFMQGYLSVDPQRTVRVRLAGDRGFLTIKGESRGSVRSEYEYEIPAIDAQELLNTLTLPHIIVKTRYLEKVGRHTWEIDVFEQENAGLIMAEIELTDENDSFEMPAWAGKEVTEDKRYYNSSLSLHPYHSWKQS